MVLAESDRLIIRPFQESDIIPYSNIIKDKDAMKFIGDGSIQTIDKAKSYILECIQCYEKHGWSRFAVEYKETGEFIGFCGFKKYNGELDFGWRYSKRYWRQGIGYEAAKAVLELAEIKFNFKKVVCISYPENLGSIRIIEKLRMPFEKKILLNKQTLLQYSLDLTEN